MFRVGDEVVYDGEDYVIEEQYGDHQVFLIGNATGFCDMVPAHLLRRRVGRLENHRAALAGSPNTTNEEANMGSIARMNRADRFIKEFGQDAVSQALKPGLKLTLDKVFLAQEDGGLEQVKLVMKFKDDQGGEYTFYAPEAYFDPEYDCGDDLVERVALDIHITEEQARERLKKANLIL